MSEIGVAILASWYDLIKVSPSSVTHNVQAENGVHRDKDTAAVAFCLRILCLDGIFHTKWLIRTRIKELVKQFPLAHSFYWRNKYRPPR